MFDFFKRKPSNGGQYISFERSRYQRQKKRTSGLSVASCKKRSWRTCGSWANVQRVMESMEQDTDCQASTTNIPAMRDSSSFLDFSMSENNMGNISGRTSLSGSNNSMGSSLAVTDINNSFAMINNTRRRWNSKLRPLQRCVELEALALKHAQAMANAEQVFHQGAFELCSSLEIIPRRRLGENVICGKDPLDMHMKMLELMTNYTNMVDCRYEDLGLASVHGANGQHYLCILFRG